jgi:nucleoside-diphosphate-sugar epimerase
MVLSANDEGEEALKTTGLTAPLSGARILVTGGAGFIATNLIEALLPASEVVVLDSLERNALALSPARRHNRLRIVKGDVRDQRLMARMVDGADYVVHMAAIAGVTTIVNRPAHALDVNLIGSYTLLSALRKKRGLNRFIDFSTSEVYGPHVFRARESGMTTVGSVYEPRWFYAVGKLAAEFLARAHYLEHGIPAVCIRPFNVYGPYQVGEGAVRNFMSAALAGRPLTVHAQGEQIRSWCYVDDMTRAILLALTKRAAIGQHFNIGNPRATTSTLALAQTVLRLTGSRSMIRYRNIKYPDVEVRVPSIHAAQRYLGYEPRVDLDEGLQLTIDWYRKHPGALNT